VLVEGAVDEPPLPETGNGVTVVGDEPVVEEEPVGVEPVLALPEDGVDGVVDEEPVDEPTLVLLPDEGWVTTTGSDTTGAGAPPPVSAGAVAGPLVGTIPGPVAVALPGRTIGRETGTLTEPLVGLAGDVDAVSPVAGFATTGPDKTGPASTPPGD
jgi:hypothetical protein